MCIILVLPAVTLSTHPDTFPLYTGEVVTLKCEIPSFGDWTYRWYMGNMSKLMNVTVQNSITMTASKAEEAQYFCSAERKGRPSASQRSNTVNITVKGMHSQPHYLLFYLKLHSPLNTHCASHRSAKS